MVRVHPSVSIFWGFSSDGRASALQAEGHRFDPDKLHNSLTKLRKVIMKRTDLELKVYDFSTSQIAWQREAFENQDIQIGILAWNPEEMAMVDADLCDEFPILETLGLADEGEGFLSYYETDKTVAEMVRELRALGFNASVETESFGEPEDFEQ